MSEEAFEFIRIKEELLSASKFLMEHLDDYENFNTVTFRNQLLEIQSKVSTLCSLSKTDPRNHMERIKDMSDDLFRTYTDILLAKNEDDRVYNIGKLAGAAISYLNEVNSLALRVVEK